MPILIIGESTAAQLVTPSEVVSLTEQAFVSLHRGQSLIFPTARGHGSDPSTRFGVKSGYDGLRRLPGLKIGSYWPDNVALGIGAHGSTTLLLDDQTGAPTALIASTHLTALRTAAADAVAVKYLARDDASVLALIGTGQQAYYEALAVAGVREIAEVLVWGRSPDRATELARRLKQASLAARPCALDEAVRNADIISTVTASRQAIGELAMVRPGTHVSAMGADGPGKQELPLSLVAGASLFADDPAQSAAMGEFQHAYAAGVVAPAAICALGAVAAGEALGRRSDDEITIFDSSGVALQDLALAALVLERARSAQLGVEIAFQGAL